MAAFVRHGILDPKIINAMDNLQPLGWKENLQKHDQYDEVAFVEYLKKHNIKVDK